MKTIKKYHNIYYFLFSISLIYFLMFFAFYIVCFFDGNGLYKLIIQNETYKNLPFTLSDLDIKNLSQELMKYISGKLQFLETKVTINNVLTEFYNVKCKIHMSDVRNIIVNLKNISFVSIIICIFSLYKIIEHEDAITKLKTSYSRMLVSIIVILMAIVIFAYINFNSFFTLFHQVLFTNDLWLLDPDEDYIICLLPEKIFMIYGLRITIATIIGLLLPYFSLQILSKTQPHPKAK